MQLVWGITISLFLCCCLWESEANRRFNTIAPVTREGDMLNWGFIHMCRTGFVNGYSMKAGTESNGGTYGIRLRCSESGNTIISREGRNGEWTPFTSCSEGHFLNAYRFRIIPAGSHKVVNVQFKCSDDSTLNEIGPQQGGDFTSWSSSCKKGGICGMKTNVNEHTLLANAYFQCCDRR